MYVPETMEERGIGQRLTMGFRKSLIRDLENYVKEHYPASPLSSVYPYEDDSSIAIAIAGNKYSPSNFWYYGSSTSWRIGIPHL